MDEKALKILEYNKITEMLKKQASSEMAKDLAMKLKPYTDVHTIRDELRSTTEAVDLTVHKGPLPIGPIYDIDRSLLFARKGGTLTMRELLQIHYNLSTAGSVVSYVKGDMPPIPIIMSMVELLELAKDLEDDIDRCIVTEDEMADNASPTLKSIRRSLLRQKESIKAKMNQIISSKNNQTYLQDAIVTMRDGRFVIPVKQEHKGKFSGIVHDQSSTGATLFIEPEVIVNLNNQLRELELAEKVEVERILAELSSRVNEHYHGLKNNQKLLINLDYIMAKGKLSIALGGSEPTINEDNILDIKQGRHPLIDGKAVVPITVSVGDEYDTLVVTGPNTGGKTVTLKTIGLLAMMAQSGLHIPASSLSKLPIFTDIFADIGDEQSIEQSLSTFSSHMRNIVDIVDKGITGTLVLLDELGAGTDPTEGAALAIAIIEKLRSQGAMTVATTHYNEIKKFALSTEGVENASMEFNVETLSPTYRLIIGIPGKSNAFEISKKLGLLPDIIETANSLIEGRDIEFQDVLSAIEKDKKKAEDERDEAIMLNLTMKKKQQEVESKIKALELKQEKIISDAREEARAIIRDAKTTAEDVKKELKELSKISSLGERNTRLTESKKKLKVKEDKYREKLIMEVNNKPVDVSTLKVGDRVKVLTLDQNGEILTLPDSKGDMMVKVGIMKVSVNVKNLVLINDGTKKKKEKKTSKYGAMYRQKSMSISISINVQGKNLDDAAMDVDKYLDDAYIAGLEEVTIIHGRGEGILKNGLRDLLKRHSHVESFRRGAYNEGGEGITVVKLRK